MASRNLSPYMTFPDDHRRRSDVSSEREIQLKSQSIVKAEKILPPISRDRHYNVRINSEDSFWVTPLSRSKVEEKSPKIHKLFTFEGRNTNQKTLDGNKRINVNKLPLCSPKVKVEIARINSSSKLASHVVSSKNVQNDVGNNILLDIMSRSDGAQILLPEQKRIKRSGPELLRNYSYQNIESITGLKQNRLDHRGSDYSLSPGLEFVTSPGIGSTMRLREPRAHFPSTSSGHSDTSLQDGKFLPLRRRKSSNIFIDETYDLTQSQTRLRRRSSVASVTFPDVLRDSRFITSARANFIQEPKFFKTKLSRSRRASSTSDDVAEHKFRELSVQKHDAASLGTEDSKKHTHPGRVLGQVQRRMKVGYLSHQFIKEMRTRRREKTRRHPTNMRSEAPIERFRRIARSVRLLLRCLTDYRTIATVSETSQMPFSMFSSDLTTRRTYADGLTFDVHDYRATNERQINPELRRIMTIAPSLRTEKELNFALKSLRVMAEAFGEFPIRMQESLVRVTWLDEFESRRVIIRQGQPAENFYFIVAGSALVSKNRVDVRTGELFVETVNILKRGMSFGELAIMRRETRSANVISNSSLALLTVHREDFVDIFMHRMDGEEPEFISFLRKRPEFSMFPLQQIPRNKPKICAFTYFRVGVVICDETTENDVIVIVKSGFCKVLKAMKTVKTEDKTKENKTGRTFKFKSSLVTGGRKQYAGNIASHSNDIKLSYGKWLSSHPLTVDTLKLLDDEEYTLREGRRRPSLIEIEHNTNPVKLAKELEDTATCPLPMKYDTEDMVYIHVQTLGEGDVFGLAPLLFDPAEGGVPMSLVSDGAECILLNKNFYFKNMDAEIREKLVRTVQPYPTEKVLKENMIDKCNWEAFKHKTMDEYITNHRARCSLKINGFQRYR